MGFGFGNINQNMNKHRRREYELPAERDEARGMRRMKEGPCTYMPRSASEELDEMVIEKLSEEDEDEPVEKQAKDTSALRDFAGGIDPTGVTTFNNAMQNEKNHKRHKAIGNVGGFVGGAVIGAAVPAALGFGVAKALKGRNPMLSKDFSNMAKGSLDILSPRRMKRHYDSLPDLMKYRKKTDELMRKSDDVMEAARKAKADGAGGLSGLKNKLTDENLNYYKGKFTDQRVRDAASDLPDVHKELRQAEKVLRDKYYDGGSVQDGASRSLTALTSVGTGLLGGTLNAVSANAQYDTAQRMKDRGKTASILLNKLVLEKLGKEVTP